MAKAKAIWRSPGGGGFLPLSFAAEPHRTKASHTEPALTLPPQTEEETTVAGCLPGAGPRRTKKIDFVV